MIRKIKTLAVIAGLMIAGVIFWYIVITFMWTCHYAGIPM